jgi:hypothetical protein
MLELLGPWHPTVQILKLGKIGWVFIRQPVPPHTHYEYVHGGYRTLKDAQKALAEWRDVTLECHGGS